MQEGFMVTNWLKITANVICLWWGGNVKSIHIHQSEWHSYYSQELPIFSMARTNMTVSDLDQSHASAGQKSTNNNWNTFRFNLKKAQKKTVKYPPWCRNPQQYIITWNCYISSTRRIWTSTIYSKEMKNVVYRNLTTRPALMIRLHL